MSQAHVKFVLQIANLALLTLQVKLNAQVALKISRQRDKLAVKFATKLLTMIGALIHACNAKLANGYSKIPNNAKNVTLDAINAHKIS